MATYSKITALLNGLQSTIDFSTGGHVLAIEKLDASTSVKIGSSTILAALAAKLVLLDSTTNGSSGADQVGVSGTPTNYTAASADIQAHLEGIDAALATAGGTDFSDAVFRISDNTTSSKKIAFEASGISASTTRTITMPDADVNLGDIAGKVTANGAITGATNTKITYDSKGLVTAGTILDASDIPTLPQSKTTGLTTDLAAKVAKAGSAMDSAANITFSGGGEVLGLPATPSVGSAATSKTYVDSLLNGLLWLDPLQDSNLIGTSTSPIGSPVKSDAYIIGTGGATGAWSAFAVGDVVHWNGTAWALVKAAAIGDRYGISFETATAAVGDAVAKENYIGVITGGSAGSWTWSWTAPAAKNAIFVENPTSYLFGTSYTYNGTSSAWIEFGGPSATGAGIGLSYDGNTLNVNLGAGIAQLPSDEIGVEVHADGGLFTTSDNSAADTGTSAKLAVKLDGTTLQKSSSGLKVNPALSVTSVTTSGAVSAGGAVTGTNLSGTNTGDQTITLTGNVTGSGTGSFVTTIANGAVNKDKLAANAFDSLTISGGNGTSASVNWAPQVIKTYAAAAGETMASDYLFFVRWAINGETAQKIYKASVSETGGVTDNKFWAIGATTDPSNAGVQAGYSVNDNITIVEHGLVTLGGSNTPFASTDRGKPVWLSTGGGFTLTPPSTAGQANYKVGIVYSTTQIYVGHMQLTGIA